MPVVILVGPTASGKSSLAVRIAKKWGGEIISADSRQVYRGLDIGTGKITKKEMGGVRHYLLDVAPPRSVFNADDYVRLARTAIADIHQRGKLPIVVGGTGFYVDALVGRVGLPSVAPNTALRKKLGTKSAEELFALIKKLDPVRAKALSTPSERNNPVRLIRAIEIASAKSSRTASRKTIPSYDVLWLGIQPADDVLRKKIQVRLHDRLAHGMIAEAKNLHAKGLSWKRMMELGLEYRALARFLKGSISRADMESELQQSIWKYARRQITYWKRNKDIAWFDPKESMELQRKISAWLRK